MSLQAMHEQQKRQESSSIERLQAENSRLSSQILRLQSELQQRSQEIVSLNEKIGNIEQESSLQLVEEQMKEIERQKKINAELEKIAEDASKEIEGLEKENERQLKTIKEAAETFLKYSNLYKKLVPCEVMGLIDRVNNLEVEATIFGGVKGLKMEQWEKIKESVKSISEALSQDPILKKEMENQMKIIDPPKGIRARIAENENNKRK